MVYKFYSWVTEMRRAALMCTHVCIEMCTQGHSLHRDKTFVRIS